jgi:hypothetical protein
VLLFRNTFLGDKNVIRNFVFISAILLFSAVVYTQNEEPGNTQEFEQYRPRIIEIYGKLKPTVKKIVAILKNVNSKEKLEEHRNNIIEEIKIMVPDAIRLQTLAKSFPQDKQFAFIMWTINVDPEMGKVSIELRTERNRIKQIPGCAEIMKEIDAKAKEYGRQRQ